MESAGRPGCRPSEQPGRRSFRAASLPSVRSARVSCWRWSWIQTPRTRSCSLAGFRHRGQLPVSLRYAASSFSRVHQRCSSGRPRLLSRQGPATSRRTIRSLERRPRRCRRRCSAIHRANSPSVPPVPETGQPPVRPTNLLSAWKVLFHPPGHRVFGSGPMSDQQPRINGRLLPDVGEHGGRAHLAQFSDPFAAQPRGVHHHPFLVPALTHGKYPSRSRGN